MSKAPRLVEVDSSASSSHMMAQTTYTSHTSLSTSVTPVAIVAGAVIQTQGHAVALSLPAGVTVGSATQTWEQWQIDNPQGAVDFSIAFPFLCACIYNNKVLESCQKAIKKLHEVSKH